MIRLFNSLTQQKEPFEPRDPGKAGIYCCGPTVYNLVHVGNARPYVTFAVLRSLAARTAASTSRWSPTSPTSTTRSSPRRTPRARDSAEVAEEYTAAYVERHRPSGHPASRRRAQGHRDDPRDHRPRLPARRRRATPTRRDGSVYFRVRSFAEYGKLSKQRIDELEEGVRVDTEPGKARPARLRRLEGGQAGRAGLGEPVGQGRPGWHIECSAMGLRYLGAGFDIHGGGRDLIFPHHENEIAQSEAAGLPFARVWMHNGMIRSEGEKMAKSVGNIFLLREVLDRYDRRRGAHVLPHDALPQPARVLAPRSWTRRRPPTAASPTPSATSTSASPTPARRASARRVPGAAAARRGGARRPSPSTWTTISTRPARSASCSPWSARCIAISPRSTAARRRSTPRRSPAVRDVLAESLGVLLIAAAGARRGHHRRRATSPATMRRRAPPAASPCCPPAGSPRRAAGTTSRSCTRDRLGCGDASYACVLRDHYRAEKQLGRRRPTARRDPGGRLRGARHAAGHAGRQGVSRGGAAYGRAADQPKSSAPTSAPEPSMPPAMPSSERGGRVPLGALRRRRRPRTRLAAASDDAAAEEQRPRRPRRRAPAPPCMTATGSSVEDRRHEDDDRQRAAQPRPPARRARRPRAGRAARAPSTRRAR